MTNLRNIDLQLLDALIALVNERSVTRASERMKMSQPQMSKVLARLRRLFGDPLLVRSKQGMTPTERALQIASVLQTGLSHIDSALETRKPFDPAGAEGAQFILAMSDYVSSLLIPGLVQKLTHTAPSVRIAIKMTDPARVRDWLEVGECDMAFGFFMHLGKSLRAALLMADQATCIVRTGHPFLASGMSIEDFRQASHAVMGGEPAPASTLEQMVDSACAELSFHRHVALKAPSLNLLADVVATTDLVATVPQSLGARFIKRNSVRLLPEPLSLPSMNITMVWHERTHLHPAHVWLRQQIRLATRDLVTGQSRNAVQGS